MQRTRNDRALEDKQAILNQRLSATAAADARCIDMSESHELSESLSCSLTARIATKRARHAERGLRFLLHLQTWCRVLFQPRATQNPLSKNGYIFGFLSTPFMTSVWHAVRSLTCIIV